MKRDGEVSQRGKQEKQMQNRTVELKKRAFSSQSSPEAVSVTAYITLCTGYQTFSSCAEFAANLQSSEVLGVLHSSLLGLQTSLWLGMRRHPVFISLCQLENPEKCSLFPPVCQTSNPNQNQTFSRILDEKADTQF